MKTKFIFCIILLLQTGLSFAQSHTRIVSVGAGVTQLLVALGEQHNIVAVDSTSRQIITNPSLPILGYQRNLNTEGILSVQPQYVIGTEEMGPENVLQQLQQAGIKVIKLVNANNDIQDLQQHIQQLGELLQQSQKAGQLLEHIQQQLHKINAQHHPMTNALALVLAENNIMAAGKQSVMASMLNLMQLDNLAQTNEGYYPYSIESILAQQPKVLLVAQRSLSQDLTDTLAKYPFLHQLSAVKNQCIFTVDGQALLGGFNLTTLQETQRIMQEIKQNDKCQ